MTTSETHLPAWLLGAWKREWIRSSDGVTTNTLTVRYLQTPSVFGDVRIPIDRPKFPDATALSDLEDDELALLAKQRGFFGYTTYQGQNANWHHELAYQPPDGTDDIGRLERAGASSMLEHGLDGSFTEHWWSMSSGDGKFLAIRVERNHRLERMLVVAGDHFAFARNRAKDLPTADSLDDLIAKATRAEVLEYLDCELSHGLVRSGTVPWQITESTLPWREGTHLTFVDTIDVATLRAPGDETWTVPVNTMNGDDLRVLFAR